MNNLLTFDPHGSFVCSTLTWCVRVGFHYWIWMYWWCYISVCVFVAHYVGGWSVSLSRLVHPWSMLKCDQIKPFSYFDHFLKCIIFKSKTLEWSTASPSLHTPTFISVGMSKWCLTMTTVTISLIYIWHARNVCEHTNTGTEHGVFQSLDSNSAHMCRLPLNSYTYSSSAHVFIPCCIYAYV